MTTWRSFIGAVPRGLRFLFLGATVGIGLAVHLHGLGLTGSARDIVGDALWAAMIFWLISIATHTDALMRAAAAFAICGAIELSQRITHSWLEAVRGSTLGHLVIGSDFDARDLAAYAGGIAAAALIDALVADTRRRTRMMDEVK